MSRWLARFRVALQLVLRRDRAERDLDEELQYHLERETHEHAKAGVAPEEARSAALRAMGAIEKHKEECRDLRRGSRVAAFTGGLFQDLRFALRLFRKHPAPVGITVGGLALAIGVATAVFSLVNASMLRPYGMDDPSSVVSIARPGLPGWVGWSYARFLRMREGTTLATVEAALPDRVRFSATPASNDAPKRPILFVSGGYMHMLGGRPSLGRSLESFDDTPGAAPAVVVSHYFWQTELNGDPSIVGKTVWMNGVPVTLVGVLQPSFTGPVTVPQSIWATFASFDDLLMGPPFTPTATSPVEVIARLSPGVTPRTAQEILTTILNRPGASRSVPAGNSSAQGVQVYSAASPIDGFPNVERYVELASVFGIIGLVLALACANAANLLMAAAVTRMREVGVRLAIGATRQRLVRQLVSESLLLGLMAGGLGFVLAFWLVPIFGAMVQMSPEINLAPDGRVLLFAVAVALVSGLCAGVSPARFGARGDVLGALQAQSGARGTGTMRSRLRTSFVGFQAAVSMLLLVVAAMLTRTAMQTTHVKIGFDADHLLAVSLQAPRSAFDEPDYVRTALAAVRDLPSVQDASVSQYEPFGPSRESDRFTYGGRSYELNVSRSDAEFFSTAGLRILRGRGFTADEVEHEASVVLISDSIAKVFFQGIDPLGQSLANIPAERDRRQQPALIVGIVGDALLTWLDSERYGTIYRPISLHRNNPPSLLIRSANPGVTARAVENVLRPIDTRVRPTTRIVRDGLDTLLEGKQRLAWLVGPTALLALVLAALGVYGVTAFVVGQRMEEVGVRMAMGATSADVMGLLVKDSLRPVVIGLGAGLSLALVISRVFAEEIGGISPHDPLSIGVALSILLACAFVAVVVPARRAARMDPAGVLRRQ